MGFRNKKVSGAGSVLFRGTLPPRAEEFQFLRSKGITLKPAAPKESHWGLSMSHPVHGEAELICLKNAPVPPATIIDYSGGMTAKERDEVRAGRTMVSVTNGATTGDLLRDRKSLLWFLRQVMGDDGVGAMDHAAERFWPRAALDFELSHDAPLDVESLYVVHAVTDSPVPSVAEQEKAQAAAAAVGEGDETPERTTPYWVHTHGLAQLGAFDLDIIDPSMEAAGDCLRSLAYAALEGEISPSTGSFQLAHPGGFVRMVPADQFMRKAAPRWRSKRDDDPDHNQQRSVVCDPAGRLARVLGDKPTPSRFLMRDDIDQCVLHFSSQASDQMAERARLTIGMCRLLQQEFAEFEFPCLVKIAYPTDTRDSQEHLWFRVHEFGEDDVDATLLNKPFEVASLTEGQRSRHSLENLSDWQISTPFGAMNPRETRMARGLRENPEQAAEMLKMFKMMREMGIG